MRKFLILLFFTLCSFYLMGCSNTNFISFESKPSSSYYSDELYKITKNNKFSLKVLDMNMYKEKTVKDDEKEIINDFIKHLDKSKNYIKVPSDFNEKDIKYKMFIVGNNEKYVINVYNEKYCCIHPWDGIFSEDFITSENIPLYYNLYGFCKYLFQEYN